MRKRLLCLGLVATATQLFGTGCFFHPIARYRANHPCGFCDRYHPLLHPIQTRRAYLGTPSGAVPGPVGGPVVDGPPAGVPVGGPPCHGCEAPGFPVAYGAFPVAGGVVPGVMPGVAPGEMPSIGQPIPIAPGPTVIPSHQLPNPMPVPQPKDKGNGNGAN